MRALVAILTVATLTLGAVSEARSAPPAVAIQATPSRGPAPLAVTLAATGDAATYRWDLGDGSIAEGAVVRHTYARGGAYVATVTARAPSGETAQAQVVIVALEVSLAAPRIARYRSRPVFRGRVVPAAPRLAVALRLGDRVVARGRTRSGGRFRLRSRVVSAGPYTAAIESAVSPPVSVTIRPRIWTSLQGERRLGARLVLRARLQPPSAGRLLVRVFRGGRERMRRVATGPLRLPLDTRDPRRIELRLAALPAAGFARASRLLRVAVVPPVLSRGARGPGVRALEARLADLHLALRGVDSAYGADTYEAVLAFQKLHGLPRTGVVDRRTWARLRQAGPPRPRHLAGTHFEVDKSRQILFEVVRGRVRRVVHVSTGATGNTPVGTWRVYRKAPGWDGVLWYPMYFLRGFAIHGYPSVPPWPASHGCVRTPLWIAPALYAAHPYGTAVIVY
jgi:N-acetylmuramoyl-L-alanine amidase